MTFGRSGLPLAACAFAAALSTLAAHHLRAQATEAPLPLWAYPVVPPAPRVPGAPRPAPDPHANDLMHVPGSKAEYAKKAIPDLFTVPDWFPEDHPAMPDVVRDGRHPDTPSCGHCHLPNGFGRPENQSIAGLPKDYIIEQFADFKSGARKSSEPHMGSTNLMVRVAKSATPEEIETAATYFASIKPKKWIRVVETDTVPKTHVGELILVADEGTEPIGNRIIELPESVEQFELRNPRSGFVAYVPTGTLKKGAAMAKTCTVCHGANLKGMGNVPSIAGRSPSQMTRQLIDFQRGNRNGAGAALMKPIVANMTEPDMIAITGYLASLEP